MIREPFQGLTDPRMARAQRPNLLDIVALTLGAVICGADNWVEIAEFGQAKADGLRGFLALPNGIPSHDTLGRVFSRRDPEQLPAGFRDGARSISERTQGEVIALDGKTLRGSGDRGSGRRPLHLVSPWASANRLTLGPGKTAAKSNEITVIPQLLTRLDLRSCLVTIARIARRRAAAPGANSELSARSAGEITAEIVFAAAGRGDCLAREIVEDAIQTLAVGLVNVLHLYNPDLLVMGGGVSAGLVRQGLLPHLNTLMLARAMSDGHRNFRLVPSRLGDAAGMLGAAALVWGSDFDYSV